MSTALNNRPEKIHALTSLRFFAAFYVVLFHTVPLVFGDRMQATLTQRAISLGYVSVSFFSYSPGTSSPWCICGVEDQLISVTSTPLALRVFTHSSS